MNASTEEARPLPWDEHTPGTCEMCDLVREQQKEKKVDE